MTPESILFQPNESVYKPFEMEVKGISSDTTKIKLYCNFHGVWWFERIGETNIFGCMHANHKGSSTNGKEIRIDAPAKYNNGNK